MVTQVLQRRYERWEAVGASRLRGGEEVVADPLKAIKRSAGSEAAMQSRFCFHLEVVTEPGRLGLTTSQVTAGIAVENSPEIYGGELTDAVKPSQLT